MNPNVCTLHMFCELAALELVIQHVSDDEIKLQTYFSLLSAVFDVTAHVVVVPLANHDVIFLRLWLR